MSGFYTDAQLCAAKHAMAQDSGAVKVHDTGIAYEFTVTTPDGHELWFHDCWNP